MPDPDVAVAPPQAPAAALFELMRTTRAMRRLRPDPLPPELLRRLLEAATWAPSGGNNQGYTFVVVTDRAQLARLAVPWREVVRLYLVAAGRHCPPTMTPARHARLLDALRYQAAHFEATPALIVCCYDLRRRHRAVLADLPRVAAALLRLGPRRAALVARNLPRALRLSAAASVYPGVQNLLLAARALGLAANLTTWHLVLEGEFKRVLGIPRHVTPYAIVPVGYPRGRFGPVRRQLDPAVVHQDRW